MGGPSTARHGENPSPNRRAIDFLNAPMKTMHFPDASLDLTNLARFRQTSAKALEKTNMSQTTETVGRAGVVADTDAIERASVVSQGKK